jgi:hypothetical protein
LSGSQRLLMGNNAHYGNPASSYIQAVPSYSTIAYTSGHSNLTNNRAVGNRLGISATKQPTGNPAGITVDTTPSVVLTKERPVDSILQPVKSSSSSSYSHFNIFEGRQIADEKDEDTSFNPPLGYTNFLGHPRANNSYMTQENPSSRLISSSSSSNGGAKQTLDPAPQSLSRQSSYSSIASSSVRPRPPSPSAYNISRISSVLKKNAEGKEELVPAFGRSQLETGFIPRIKNPDEGVTRFVMGRPTKPKIIGGDIYSSPTGVNQQIKFGNGPSSSSAKQLF